MNFDLMSGGAGEVVILVSWILIMEGGAGDSGFMDF